ncbi:hypothetical protein Leryth_007217 [Lithospermum erythrorhizon]|nr:hypothetical protein Leryth_007217 [Lithospermum erythrorhizon]
MECLGRKRKGVDAGVNGNKDFAALALVMSHLSLEDYSRRKKKCRDSLVKESAVASSNVVTGVATAPPCGGSCLDSLGRGLKRKIGCIDAATRLGRKKKIGQDYEVGKVLGKGRYGSVVMCQRKTTREQFACKTLRKGEETVHREVEIMQHLSGHPGIVTLKAVYEDVESFHLVMELCTGGRLLDLMARERQQPEHQIAMMIKELMMAINYCHEMGVVHRDIKPENILLTYSEKLKLADFGLAVRISEGQSLAGVVGSPAYIAPEVLLGDYSEKVDIWSAGVVLHALLVGVLPYQGDTAETVFKAIKEETLDFHNGVWESVSLPARHLISCMMTRDVSKRFSAKQVLTHPWILFYTETSLTTLTPRSDIKNHVKLTSKLTRMELECSNAMSSNLSDDSLPTNQQCEGSGLIDILTEAVSRVKISGAKRSRICNPAQAVPEQGSSNMIARNLCRAF